VVDPDTRLKRKAALWATAIAVPVAVLVGILAFVLVQPDSVPAAKPSTPVPDTPVQMAAPKLSARAAQVCLAVTSQLPDRVRDLPARRVSAGPEQNAAYGEPPLTVACGVEQPRMCQTLPGGPDCVPLDTSFFLMDKVCWYAKQTPEAAVFTTMDREVAVQVTVPASYAQAAQWANEFSDIVVATDKSVPSDCD
jgi:hypothetical protein